MRDPEKHRVIQAICVLRNRVTASDVVSATGMSLESARRCLNEIAAETAAHLEVNISGNIVYCFSPNFQLNYLARGAGRAFQVAATRLLSAALYLLKISFSAVLLVSCLLILLVLSLFGLLNLASAGGHDTSQGRADWQLLQKFIFGDLFRSGESTERPLKWASRSGFLLDCFSFLFGDQNPNADVKERQWFLLGQVIKGNGGVVASEQLAPYMEAVAGDEDAILPVLVRFGGHPVVSESGNILYVFPSLTHDSSTSAEVPEALIEVPLKFTNLPSGAVTRILVLSALNFLGTSLFFALVLYSGKLSSTVALLWSTLFLYSLIFVAIPLGRLIVLRFLNYRMAVRNQARREHARLLAQRDPNLAQKLYEVEAIRTLEIGEQPDKTVFTTRRDSLEQLLEDAGPD